MLPDKNIVIVRNLLPIKFYKNQKLIHKGRYCFLAQMLERWNYTIPEAARLPSDLQIIIPYLTIECRQRIVDTPLSLSILQLDTFPRHLQLQKFQSLLLKQGLTVHYV